MGSDGVGGGEVDGANGLRERFEQASVACVYLYNYELYNYELSLQKARQRAVLRGQRFESKSPRLYAKTNRLISHKVGRTRKYKVQKFLSSTTAPSYPSLLQYSKSPNATTLLLTSCLTTTMSVAHT